MREIYKRKSNVGVFAAFIAMVVLVASLSTGLFYVGRQSGINRIQVQNYYQENMYELSENMSNVEMNMSKLLASDDDYETALLLNDTYHHTQAAVCALNALPVEHEDRQACTKFLNQLGDWCNTHAKRLGDFYAYENEDESSSALYNSQIESLYIRAKNLSGNVRAQAASLNGRFVLSGRLSNGVSSDTSGESNNLNDATEYPELIYDGPFSDANSTKNFKCLEGHAQISLKEAIERAETLFAEMGLRSVESIGETTAPDAYMLSGRVNEGDIFFSVSKCGGKVISAIIPITNEITGERQGEEFAKERAVKYANDLGYEGLIPVWYNEIDGTAIVNLVPSINGVICYPDLVKVKVNIFSGELIGFEATGYCASHIERNNLAASISEAKARQQLNPRLNAYPTRLVLIPKDMKEVLCYEFACKYEDLDYFVYINANNGRQCNIMRVIDRDQGKLVM